MDEEIEIEFLDWVHPRFGVMPAKMEGGGPLVLKAKIKSKQRTWAGLSEKTFAEACQMAERGNYLVAFKLIQNELKEKNT